MTKEQLEHNISFEIRCLIYEGKPQHNVVRNLKRLAIDYAEQFKYDYSKDCECESRTGETWCCNQCGLPTNKKTIEP